MIKSIFIFFVFYIIYKIGKFFLKFLFIPDTKHREPKIKRNPNFKNVEEAKYTDLDNNSKE